MLQSFEGLSANIYYDKPSIKEIKVSIQLTWESVIARKRMKSYQRCYYARHYHLFAHRGGKSLRYTWSEYETLLGKAPSEPRWWAQCLETRDKRAFYIKRIERMRRLREELLGAHP
jgi:hypothetical protein